MSTADGYPVVLTADRTLMADYQLLFDGMLAASQTTMTPLPLIGNLLMPRPRSIGMRARTAPMGLRRIEAALLAGGFTTDEVVVVTQDHLADVIGPATRIVGISSGEPAGLGMNSSTMTAVTGGTIYPQAMFGQLLREVKRQVRNRAPKAKLVLGGPGAWQIAGEGRERAVLGINHVVTGYAEANIAQIFQAILHGEAMPEVIEGQGAPTAGIPSIHGASTMGVVEISRGCGLGCPFCTIARTPMIHLPLETILADARTNIAAGLTSIAALSEDFFRYGAEGVNVNPAAVISLLTELRKIDGLRLIQIDHANVLSIAQYSDEQLAEVRALLVGDEHNDYPWVNVGIESASGELLLANGCKAKMGRHSAAEWGDVCAKQLQRLCRAGFFPMASLVVGLPGESKEDVLHTLAWVKALSRERISIFPVLYAPVDGGKGVTTSDLKPWHWQLIKACYRLNFTWIPRMYWDNQVGAGVPVWRRILLQMLGRGQVLEWNALFAWHAMKTRV
ncbi:MAG: B12-binding domain-containing radical SAM protein [Armatimonadota bacterium]